MAYRRMPQAPDLPGAKEAEYPIADARDRRLRVDSGLTNGLGTANIPPATSLLRQQPKERAEHLSELAVVVLKSKRNAVSSFRIPGVSHAYRSGVLC
jgi:hypothetical protein